ncbi:hypothetical protein T265_14405, partial [Opisthorchis viverrini]
MRDSTESLVCDILQLNVLHAGRLMIQLARYSRYRSLLNTLRQPTTGFALFGARQERNFTATSNNLILGEQHFRSSIVVRLEPKKLLVECPIISCRNLGDCAYLMSPNWKGETGRGLSKSFQVP